MSSSAPNLGLPASQEKPLAQLVLIRPISRKLFKLRSKTCEQSTLTSTTNTVSTRKYLSSSSLRPLRPAVESGTVRWLGLSNCSIDTLRRAKAVKGLGEKVIAVQMEYSPFTIDAERNGMSDACKELGVSLVAYSPLGRGLASGR